MVNCSTNELLNNLLSSFTVPLDTNSIFRQTLSLMWSTVSLHSYPSYELQYVYCNVQLNYRVSREKFCLHQFDVENKSRGGLRPRLILHV